MVVSLPQGDHQPVGKDGGERECETGSELVEGGLEKKYFSERTLVESHTHGKGGVDRAHDVVDPDNEISEIDPE